MAIDLYLMEMSAPCRSVRMLLEQLGLEYNMKVTNLFNGEHLKPEYIKLNPTHTIPTLVDNGYSLWESRAILAYIMNKHAPDNDLYPKDPQRRADVDRMLNYDIGTLYPALGDMVYPFFLKGATSVTPESEEKFKTKLAFLEIFLTKTKFVAADHLTIADFAIFSSLSFLSAVDYHITWSPKVQAWLETMSQLPYHQKVNVEPLNEFKKVIEAKQAEAKNA